MSNSLIEGVDVKRGSLKGRILSPVFLNNGIYEVIVLDEDGTFTQQPISTLSVIPASELGGIFSEGEC